MTRRAKRGIATEPVAIRRPSRARAAARAGAVAALVLASACVARVATHADATRIQIRDRIERSAYAEAESLALAALDGRDRGVPSPADSAWIIDDLVLARWRNDRSRTPGTTALAERGLRIRLADARADSLDLASSFESMAYQDAADGRVGEASDFAWRAIALRRTRLLGDDERIARLVHHLGVLAWFAQDYRGAADRFAEALAMRERASGPSSANAGRSLMGLAGANSVLGRSEEAAAQFSRAVAIYQAPTASSPRDLLYALNSLVVCYGRLDRVVEAGEIARRAVRVAEERLGHEHEQTANAYVSLGYAYSNEGDYARARDADRQALEIFEHGHGRPSQVIVARRYLVSTLNNAGDFDAAAREAARALRDCEAVATPDSVVLEEVCHGLAMAYQGLGRRRDANRLFRRAVAILEAKFGSDHPETVSERISLASSELDLGNVDRAGLLFDRARVAVERSSGARHSSMAGALEGLALVRQERGRYAAAESLLAEARDILEQRFGPDRVETGRAYGLLARLAERRGRRQEAMVLALHAERVSRRWFHLVAQGLAEREALRAPGAGCSTLPLMLAMAGDSAGLSPADRRAAWDAVVRSRAQVLEEMARRRRVSLPADERSRRLADSLRIARANLASLVLRGSDRASDPSFRERVERRRRDADALEEALALSDAALRRDRARDTLGLGDVERALPQDAALVAYVRYPEERPLAVSAAHRRIADTYLAFVRSPGSSAVRVVRLGPSAPLDSLVARWSVAVAATTPGAGAVAAEERARSLGVALRRRLWDPVRAGLAAASLVLIVPDGPLHLVNFAALPDGRDGYLVESGPTLQLLTAERDVVPDSTQPTGHGLIAVGDPMFDDAGPQRPAAATLADSEATSEPTRGADCGAFRRLRFRRLPGTRDEIADIARLWRSVDAGAGRGAADSSAPCITLEGRQATASELARLARGRRVVHVATHGFFLDAQCVAEQGDAGTRGVGGMAPWSGTIDPGTPASGSVAGNPLLLSGLALTGANRRNERRPGEDDGILTAEELSALDLSGLEWAVLSACRTGVGEVANGEGVFGLRRALRIAGARSVITSLWPVGDVSTRAWMLALYRARLLDRRSTAEAVRAASLSVLRDRRARHLGTSPLHWGAFLAAGDWR